jgi:hypothetical protein
LRTENNAPSLLLTHVFSVSQMADTETGTVAEEMYRKLGFTEAGKIPGYSLSPAGGLKSETFFYKHLGGQDVN